MTTADATRKALEALDALATELRNDALEDYARDLRANGPHAADPLLAIVAGDILSIAGVWGGDHGLRPECSTRRDLQRMHHAARVAVQLLDLHLAATEGA